jgi:hypothetical protein
MRALPKVGRTNTYIPPLKKEPLSPLSLDQVITTGPVDRGFYVTSGGWELVRYIQERLVDLLWKDTLRSSQDPDQNEKSPFSRVRYHRRVSKIGQFIWVDSGNSFNPYYMAGAARQRGMDANKVLRAVKVGRPFTAFQYQQMLERVPNAALLACPEEQKETNLSLPSVFSRSFSLTQDSLDNRGLTRAPHAIWWTPLVVISDLMGLFYDEELPEADLYRSFREFLIRISHLRKRAIVLALLLEDEIPPHRRHLLSEVLQLARRVSAKENKLSSAQLVLS